MRAMERTRNRIAMIDTETTGKTVRQDRIVELAVVVGRHGRVELEKSWLLNPGMPIPQEASDIHGITDQDVADAPSFSDIVDEFLRTIDGCMLAAYNAPFDKGFIEYEMERAGRLEDLPQRDWLDPLVWSRHFYKYERGKKLGDMSERLGIELKDAHRATADAKAALLVLFALSQRHDMPRTYGAFIDMQRKLAKEQQESYQRWLAQQTRDAQNWN